MPDSAPPFFPQPIDVAGFEIDETLAAEGNERFVEHCFWCHGSGAVSGGNGPDLRASAVSTTYEGFRQVVVEGRQPLGMPCFHDYDERTLQALYHYIRQQARMAVQAKTAATP